MTNPHAWLLTDLASVPLNGLRVMSTFACGGGSSMGYKRAGYQVVAANDIDPVMARHYKHNLHPPQYFLCPIRDLLRKPLPDVDILDGSPPCSNFSMAGNREKDWGKLKHFREGQSKQVLDDLFFDFLDVVAKMRPRAVIAENVKGLIIGNAKGYVRLIFTRLRELGYRPQAFLVNAADCGVPQRRERVFICAMREDMAMPELALNPVHRWVTVGQATEDVQVLTDAEIEDTRPSKCDLMWWPVTDAGRDYNDAVMRLTGKQRLWNHKKLSLDSPSRALKANDTFVHGSICRSLSFREWKRLGSFPDDYEAETERLGKYIIGMSVPPKMMEYVAREVARQWFGVEYP